MIGRAVACGLAVAALLSASSAARADGPEHYSFDASFSFLHPYLSQRCGTPVVWSKTGTDHATVWRNDAGVVVRELDYSPASKITISAPLLGTSFTAVRSTLSTWDYGAGARLGSEVTITQHGLLGNVPGHMAAEAGTTTIITTVTGFTPEGSPMANPHEGTIVRQTGNPVDPDVEAAAVCAALTGA